MAAPDINVDQNGWVTETSAGITFYGITSEGTYYIDKAGIESQIVADAPYDLTANGTIEGFRYGTVTDMGDFYKFDPLYTSWDKIGFGIEASNDEGSDSALLVIDQVAEYPEDYTPALSELDDDISWVAGVQIDEYAKLSDEDKQKFLVHFKEKMSAGYTPKDPVGAALNVEASRIAKYFNLEGINYTIDAACATSASSRAARRRCRTGRMAWAWTPSSAARAVSSPRK